MSLLTNIRGGHACNSSSSHSIIISPHSGIYEDYLAGDGEFGWQDFVAVSEEAKMKYLAAILLGNLSPYMAPELAKAATFGLLGLPVPAEIQEYSGYSIDHQSSIDLPLLHPRWGNSPKPVDLDFFNELKAFLLRKDVVIFGGNDNSSEINHRPTAGEVVFKYPLTDAGRSESILARKDGEHWVLFDKKTGNRTIFTFDEKAKPHKKAGFPYLVDISASFNCPHGCEFCYTDAKKTNKQTDLEKFEALAYALQAVGTFEVALGGGEIVVDQNFSKVVRSMHNQGINCNFTTKSRAFLNDVAKLDAVNTNCSAVAFSVVDYHDAVRLVTQLAANASDYKFQKNIQIIDGVFSPSQLTRLLQLVGDTDGAVHAVTVLGFKDAGRADRWRKEESIVPTLQTWIEEHRWRGPSLAVDTAFVQQHGKMLQELGISEKVYHAEEGIYSCYIDLPNSQIGPSSYADKKTFKPLDISKQNMYGGKIAQQILEAFATF